MPAISTGKEEWPQSNINKVPASGQSLAKMEAQARKRRPVGTGVLDYFPKALLAVSDVSYTGNVQHNGAAAPLHWDRSKSTDEADALIRHFLDRGKFDTDGTRHSAKVAWRALALLEKEIEEYEREQTDTMAKQQGVANTGLGSSRIIRATRILDSPDY